MLKPAIRRNGKFENPVPTSVGGLQVIFKALPLMLANRAEHFPRIPPGPFRTDLRVYDRAPASGLRVTWIGHSSMLLEIDGLRVLIDPVWDERASPVKWLGPRRFFAPPLALHELPQLDAVLISHDHYDHLGERSVRELAALPISAGARWITSLGVGATLRRFGVAASRISEMDWMEDLNVEAAAGGPGLTISALPARHFSGRGLTRFETLWSSFALKGALHNVYYAADSGPWAGFAEIGEKLGPFDLTMLEIGAYNELWKSIHLGPHAAAEAFRMLGGTGLMMPIHWGLFDLALHAWRQPIDRLTQLAEGAGIALWSPEPGVPTEVVPGHEHRSSWWGVDRTKSSSPS